MKRLPKEFTNLTSEIACTLQDQWQSYRRTLKSVQRPEIISDERVRHWQAKQAKESPDEPELLLRDRSSDQLEIPQKTLSYDAAALLDLDFVTTSPSYIWLTRKLIDSLRLTYLGTTVVASIHSIIHNCFPQPQKIDRQTTVSSQKMAFNVEWPLEQFLQDYRFFGADDVASILQNFVTITSDGNHTQALPALQYCRLIWGQNGEQILSLIVDLIRDGKAEVVGTEFVSTAWMDDTVVYFIITGLPDTIAEIGEQVAWMGAVFRPSPIADVIHDCITSTRNVTATGPLSYSCDITYSMVVSRSTPELGSCWRRLFRYTNIAHGFPIVKRADSIRGLEMSLGMMLALCHARHIGMINDKIIIKGFSTMLSLSERQPGSSVWHFFGDLDGPYVSSSCYVPTGEHYSSSVVHDVMHDRHFLGWCSDASYGAGMLYISF